MVWLCSFPNTSRPAKWLADALLTKLASAVQLTWPLASAFSAKVSNLIKHNEQQIWCSTSPALVREPRTVGHCAQMIFGSFGNIIEIFFFFFCSISAQFEKRKWNHFTQRVFDQWHTCTISNLMKATNRRHIIFILFVCALFMAYYGHRRLFLKHVPVLLKYMLTCDRQPK